MYIQTITDLENLEVTSERWDTLAGSCVFRSWTWLSTWWKHYGADASRKLHIIQVWEGEPRPQCASPATEPATETDHSKLAAILPCYLETTVSRGKVLKLLGDGEVCSDHLDLLVTATNAKRCGGAIADHLCGSGADWDLIDFPTLDVACEQTKITALIQALQQAGCHTTQTADLNTWSIDLPETWEDFLALQSKSHRKQLRRLQKRVLDTDDCHWHQVKLLEDFDAAWEILIDLHQKRRISLGEPGCFASEGWSEFHRDVARKLLAEGRLRLSWLELAGEPIAAEYHFAGGRTSFVYQGGLDPERLDEEPGRLSLIRCIQHAIEEGHRKFDLLRGDEPYKPHWRAVARETAHVQVVPNRQSAKLRYHTWSSVRGAARWVRQVAHLFS